MDKDRSLAAIFSMSGSKCDFPFLAAQVVCSVLEKEGFLWVCCNVDVFQPEACTDKTHAERETHISVASLSQNYAPSIHPHPHPHRLVKVL